MSDVPRDSQIRVAYLLLAVLEGTLVLVHSEELKAPFLVRSEARHLTHHRSHKGHSLVLVLQNETRLLALTAHNDIHATTRNIQHPKQLALATIA